MNLKKSPLFFLLILLVIVSAVFFRTYNYFGRVNVHADNAWELQVVRYAFDNLKIPQVGPFSSAGPFFYGPWYFWIFMIFTIFPLGFLTHWYLMTVLSLVFVYLMFWIGREVGDRWTGLLAAFFAAISTAQINNSFSVWSPALIPILVALSLVFLIKFSKRRRVLFLFILSFVVGLSISIHFQSVLILPILFAALISLFLSKPKFFTLFNSLTLSFVGFAIPFLPLIWWDWQHNWYNSVSFAVYFFVDQYKIWVPNRWLTYAGFYWPQTWAEIVGGSKYIGGLFIGLVAVFGVLKLRNWEKNKAFYLVAITFLFEVILFRYYRGERFYYYSLFAHPSVIVLTAFVTRELLKLQKILGIVLLTVIFVFTVNQSANNIKNVEISYPLITSTKADIYARYPNSKFDIYGCIFNGTRVSHPIALSMYTDGRNTLDGVKVGTCEAPDGSVEWHELLPEEYVGEGPAFSNSSTETVYRGMEEWFIKKPPGKGDLWKFLRENFRKT